MIADRQGAFPSPEGRRSGHEVVDYDLLCLRCGYNLRTLSLSGRCPECGTAVLNSWTPAPPLLRADKIWLAGIRRGMSLILLTMLLSVVGFPAMWMVILMEEAIRSALWPPAPSAGDTVLLTALGAAMCLGWLALCILGVHAVFKATAPEPGAADETDPPTRRACRWTLIAWIAATLVLLGGWVAVMFRPSHNLPNFDRLIIGWMIAGMVSLALALAAWICLMLFWRTLALRAADAMLARRTGTVAWCLGITSSLLLVLQTSSLLLMVSVARMVPAPTIPPTSSQPAALTALGYFGPTSMPTTTMAVATTMPTTMPFPFTGGPSILALLAILPCLSCVLYVAFIAFGIWWVVVVFQYRRVLQRMVESSANGYPETAPPA